MLCATCYNLHKLKYEKNTHGGNVKPATLLKITLLHTCFPRFLNCTNGAKHQI